MAKLTLYFKDQAAYDAYWGDAQPGSKYLCVIESVEVSQQTGEVLSNVLITTSNNSPDAPSGVPQEYGPSTIETVVENNAEIIALQAVIDEATDKSEEIKEGPVVD